MANHISITHLFITEENLDVVTTVLPFKCNNFLTFYVFIL